MYGDFAQVYDALMAQVDYDLWAKHYSNLLEMNGVNPGAKVLEAACGTGSLTIRLAKHYQVLPGDISPEMLSIAAQKAKALGLSLSFLRQDMRKLTSHRPVDALISGCDGVNYLLTRDDLGNFLKSAMRVLKPGGVLAFDVSSYDKLSRVLGSMPQVHREDKLAYIWENAWNARSKRLQMSLSFFVLQADGSYLRFEEEQVQRAWEEEELKDALAANGFESIQCFGDFTLNKPAKTAQRLHITARKPQ